MIAIKTNCCYPLLILPSLITKWKKGRPSLYWVRSAWVEGHSRIVEQLYLGPRDRVMEQIRVQFTSSLPPEQIPALYTVQTREFGASALFYTLALDLGLIDRINAAVPPAPPGRRTSLSVGHSLVLAPRNRAPWPQSKRAFAEWYQGTVLTRLVPASVEELSSQRFWDHMDLFEADAFAPIQRELLPRIHERFPLREQFLVSDTTNYSPFLHTFHSRPSLPQRGRNTQKRHDLRQVSLALVVDEQWGLPLYSRCDEGHVPDVVALGTSLAEMLRHFLPPPAPARLTVVLDKGNVSFENFHALTPAHFSFLAAIPAGWVRRLSQVTPQAYQPLVLPDGRRIKVSVQPTQKLGGLHGKLLVSFSPHFYRQQVRTLDRLQQQAEQKLGTLRATIQEAVVRKRPRQETAVRRALAQIVRHDRLKDFFAPTLGLHHGAVHDLHWEWDRRKKRQIKHRDFGRTILLTDRQDLSDQRLVVAYRSQATAEEMFRISKAQ